MDYKEEYQKALERAKKGLPLDEVFPELKESEDEGIRRFIIDCISELQKANTENAKFNARCGEAISYIEKQKENPKSADSIPSDCVSDAKCEDRWHKVTDSLPDNGRLVLAKDCLGNVLLARFDGENWEVNVYDNEDHYCHNSISNWCEIPSEKQKEQKPIFKRGDKVIWNGEEYNILDVNKDSYNVGGYILPFYRQNELSLVEQKPAEWSEEEIVNWFKENFHVSSFDNTKIVTKFSSMDELVKSMRKRLKSLRPQSKQEWTGATVEQVETIATHLDNLGNTAMSEILRSIHPQPHWKPNEEQMSALEYFIRSWGESGTMSPQNPTLCAAKSLYKDLKKQM